MDLNDLKKTWNQISSGKELDESELRDMLGKRTRNLIERIDRNIRIGFIVVLGLILIFAFDDFIVSPKIIENFESDVVMPQWLLGLAVFANVLICTTFIYFVIKYYRVKNSCDVICDIKETLQKIIETLLLYQRLFYLALITIMVAIGSAFITGLFEGVTSKIENQGAQLADVETGQLVLVIIVGVVILAIIIGGIFFFLRWGFRRLYGNYINKLKSTLKELEELES